MLHFVCVPVHVGLAHPVSTLRDGAKVTLPLQACLLKVGLGFLRRWPAQLQPAALASLVLALGVGHSGHLFTTRVSCVPSAVGCSLRCLLFMQGLVTCLCSATWLPTLHPRGGCLGDRTRHHFSGSMCGCWLSPRAVWCGTLSWRCGCCVGFVARQYMPWRTRQGLINHMLLSLCVCFLVCSPCKVL